MSKHNVNTECKNIIYKTRYKTQYNSMNADKDGSKVKNTMRDPFIR